ncbi:MAG TPA: beta-galactosidase, partial [Planctomycetota bacterium]|nr:beta-galactosidase [Planctomycetota bacterium]
MIRVRTILICCAAALALAVPRFTRAAEPAPPPATAGSLRADTMRLLEDIEQVRMLLGITMWKTHDVRNFVLYDDGPSGRRVLPSAIDAVEKIDRENLRLYEAIRPIDYAGSSLMQALDIGDDRTAAGDLAFIRTELGPLARQVLDHYTAVTARHERAHAALVERADKAGLKTQTITGKPWDDPVREYQRQLGVQIGWRTNIEPPADFREHIWNTMQDLDIRYQLKKGQMLGVTHLVFKDPVLRWDFIEPQKDRFEFAAFDRMMKLAIDNGYRVKLVLPTFGGRVPDWLVQERPESVIRNDKGECDYRINPGSYAHDFMGPVKREGPWYDSRPVNLADTPTRERFAKYVQAIADHCRQAGFTQHVIAVSIDLNFAQRHWRLPGKPSDALDKTHWTVAPGADRDFIILSYKAISEIADKAFAPLPLELEVTDGEAHGINWDFTAHEWRSVGLTELVGLPGVCSETPFFEDLMRATASVAVATDASTRKLGKEVEAGPFFYQDCEYGFGTMISINYFTAFLRDGLWSDGWFGP